MLNVVYVTVVVCAACPGDVYASQISTGLYVFAQCAYWTSSYVHSNTDVLPRWTVRDQRDPIYINSLSAHGSYNLQYIPSILPVHLSGF